MRAWRAAVAMAWLAGPAAAASSYSQIVVFGDSLSDVGNNGRYTAGYLWGEHLAGGFGLTLTPSSKGGTDWAYSGALITTDNGSIPSLPHQVSMYLGAHPQADAAALYVIWGGGNDVFSTIGNPGGSGAVVSAGVADTVSMIKTLYQAGARNFLIGDVPHTDLTPYVRSQGAAVMAQQAAVVASWNGKLRPALKQLRGSGVLQLYDAAGALAAIVASPTHYGFTNYTTPCGSSCSDPAHTFFWDSVHPGATGHTFIATAMLAIVSQ